MDADSDPLFWLREHGPRLLAFRGNARAAGPTPRDVLQEAFLRFWSARNGARTAPLFVSLYPECGRRRGSGKGSQRCRERDAARSPAASTMPHSLEQSELDGKIQEAVARLSQHTAKRGIEDLEPT